MSELMAGSEDNDCLKTADKVMTIHLSCNPKEGVLFDKDTPVGEEVKTF